jgi:hypothetical protein
MLSITISSIQIHLLFSFISWIRHIKSQAKRLRWSRGSVLAFSTEVRGFKPGRSRRIFKGEKILSTPSLGGEVKPSVPCRRFAACKRSLNVKWKSAFRQNYRILFSPVKFRISLFGSLASRRTWRNLTATVGTSKRRGNRVVQQA